MRDKLIHAYGPLASPASASTLIVLHAASATGRVWLWAEAPPEDYVGASGVPQSQRGPPPPLPFDAGPDRLVQALDRAAGGFPADPDRLVPLVAWLPVRGRRPIPSSPLVAELPTGPGRIRLRSWTVTGLSLDGEEALTLLATAVDREILGPGLPVSRDLAFWSEALTLAARLVAGGHVHSGLVEEDGRHLARWDPVFQGGRPGRAGPALPPDASGGPGSGGSGPRRRTWRTNRRTDRGGPPGAVLS